MVAGGLQNDCGTADDAIKVSTMALKMIDVTESVLSPEGLPLRVFPESESLSLPILYTIRGKL